ncbi:WD repeat containing protein [Parasponia andersonii]|uniref:WD repeat containing protein n=1 Tax=Parasponia andersonii TaxID=3476 RepID=A0A2P5D1Q8_PARAD|nr:WD repeat containing protein [Parasponia andersonii]
MKCYKKERPYQSLSPGWCVLCKKDSESQDHLFLHCEFSIILWYYILKGLGRRWVIPRFSQDLLEVGQGLFGNQRGRLLWKVVVLASLWALWLERNRRIFEGVEGMEVVREKAKTANVMFDDMYSSCGASMLSSTDCASQKQRRWPEDIAWHPNGNCLFSAYCADGGDTQISVLDLNRTQGRARVAFLEDKPHVKGIINSIVFMPWENARFVTGGSDHAVVLWDEKDDNIWKPKALHRNFHSSAVMGVAGMQQKHIVLSAGSDKRVIGFDANVGRADFKHQIDSKCMSVLPNPCDFNLFMVHAGTLERQLRLFDIRLRQTEIHAFGWKQESSESQSALINQSWSPDGLYITSGSADPMIHIFDIRYNASKPSQSIRAHHKRVFKAVWLQSLPLLVSISSDLNVGLHKIS